jgi:hypothetical protein
MRSWEITALIPGLIPMRKEVITGIGSEFMPDITYEE